MICLTLSRIAFFGINSVDFFLYQLAEFLFVDLDIAGFVLLCRNGFICERIKNCLLLFEKLSDLFVDRIRAKQSVDKHIPCLSHSVSSCYCLIFD